MGRNFRRRCCIALDGGASRAIYGGRDNELRIDFHIRQWTYQSSNQMSFRIWNPNLQTIKQFQGKEFQSVTFSAGYEDNIGVVFKGDLKQTIDGHETAADTFIDLFAADGDRAYNQSRATKTLAAGYTPKDKMQVALDAMAPFGITLGKVNVDLSQPSYPRGAPLFGMARDILRQVALSAGATWSMQMGALHIIDPRKPIPSSGAIKLTAATGLVGWPRQTADGVQAVSLINPSLMCHQDVELDPSQVIQAEYDNNPFSGSAGITNQELDQQKYKAGTYNIIALERRGSTRGSEWYDEMLMIGKGGSTPVSQKSLGRSTLGGV